MVLPEQHSENVARRARALEHCLEECGGCANRPETCWEPHLAVVGTFFTLTLARPTTSRDPSRHCFIRGHVCCDRHPLDKVSDATFSEATFSWVTLTFLADGAGVGAEECRGTYVRLGDSDSLEDALSCSAKHTLIREQSGPVHQCTQSPTKGIPAPASCACRRRVGQPRHPTRCCRRPRCRFLHHHGRPALDPVVACHQQDGLQLVARTTQTWTQQLRPRRGWQLLPRRGWLVCHKRQTPLCRHRPSGCASVP